MTRRLSYDVDAARDQRPEQEPVEIELTFTRPPSTEKQSAVFRCGSEMPGGVIEDMVALLGADEMIASAKIVTFVRSCILPEDLPRYERLIKDPAVRVPIEMLGQISMDLIALYTNRPTQPVSGSSPGQPRTGDTSVPASASPSFT